MPISESCRLRRAARTSRALAIAPRPFAPHPFILPLRLPPTAYRILRLPSSNSSSSSPSSASWRRWGAWRRSSARFGQKRPHHGRNAKPGRGIEGLQGKVRRLSAVLLQPERCEFENGNYAPFQTGASRAAIRMRKYGAGAPKSDDAGRVACILAYQHQQRPNQTAFRQCRFQPTVFVFRFRQIATYAHQSSTRESRRRLVAKHHGRRHPELYAPDLSSCKPDGSLCLFRHPVVPRSNDHFSPLQASAVTQTRYSAAAKGESVCLIFGTTTTPTNSTIG